MLLMPKPPSFAGSRNTSRIVSVTYSFPISAGTKVSLINQSSFLRSSVMSGVVLATNVHLLDAPKRNAEYASCGSLDAISVRDLMY